MQRQEFSTTSHPQLPAHQNIESAHTMLRLTCAGEGEKNLFTMAAFSAMKLQMCDCKVDVVTDFSKAMQVVSVIVMLRVSV
jgi:hypothetical protein